MPRPPDLRGVVRPPDHSPPWSVAQWPAPPRRADAIARLWRVAWAGLDEPFVQDTLPDPVLHLVFEGGRAEVQGPLSSRFRRELVGAGWVLGVKFRPAGFRLVARDLWALRDRRAPAGGWLPGVDALAAALPHRSEPERVAAVTAWLDEALDPAGLSADDQAIRDLVERLQSDATIGSVAAAAALEGVSERTLQRRFRTAVGWTPAEVLRRRRIQDAMAALEAGAPALADLAYTLGYADQAHLSRDFRALVGIPPSRYARRRRPGGPGRADGGTSR